MKLDFRRIYLPYCLQRQADGRYAVLNRDYKPLGFSTGEWVEYGAYPVLAKFKRMTSKIAAQLSWRGDADIERIYLYADECVPTATAANMRAYLDRLALLAHVELSPPPR